jgi:hypothetical protein
MKNKAISTLKMVQNMMNESAEVKRSVGKTKEFRDVLEFVITNKWYQDYITLTVNSRSSKEIEIMVNYEFNHEIINEAKSVYNH